MFQPPQEIATTVFAELPARFRRPEQSSEWKRGQPGETHAHSALEGPSFDREGRLWCVDIAFGRIFRVSAGGEFELVAEYDGEPNGLKIHRDGRIFIADYKNGIMRLDPATGAVVSVLARHRLERFKGVNDLVFASNGDLYFTDQGLTGLHDPTGAVYRLRADGTLDQLLDNVPSPNGIVLNPQETQLYVAVTRGNCVWRVPLLEDGGVTKVGNFIAMSGGVGPDGLAVDQKGNLAVAHVGLGSVWLFSPQGEPLYRIRSCRGLRTTNIAYGGPDGKSLFITETETGSILKAELPVPGQPMYSHR